MTTGSLSFRKITELTGSRFGDGDYGQWGLWPASVGHGVLTLYDMVPPEALLGASGQAAKSLDPFDVEAAPQLGRWRITIEFEPAEKEESP